MIFFGICYKLILFYFLQTDGGTARILRRFGEAKVLPVAGRTEGLKLKIQLSKQPGKVKSNLYIGKVVFGIILKRYIKAVSKRQCQTYTFNKKCVKIVHSHFSCLKNILFAL